MKTKTKFSELQAKQIIQSMIETGQLPENFKDQPEHADALVLIMETGEYKPETLKS